MKKSFYLMAAFLVAMVGCNKEPQHGVGQDDASGDAVYMSFKVSTLETKSSTEDDGTSDANPDFEIGSADENAVNSLQLFITKTDGTIVTQSTGMTPVGQIGNSISYVAKLNAAPFLDENKQSKDGTYNVYIYANMSLADETTFNLDATTTLAEDNLTENIAQAKAFIMTNADNDNQTTIPEDLSPYTVESNPLNLGTFNLERTAARFDYGQAVTNDKYTVIKDKDGNPVLDVQLTDIALVNLSKSYYHFRRVSATGTNVNWAVGGRETQNNYVVDTDWELKSSAKANVADLPENFLYPLNANDESGLSWTALSSITTADNYEAETDDRNYKVWRYATENTIAGGTDNQINAASTGVVFRAKFVPAASCPEALKTAINAATDPLYVFQNTLYGTWEMVVEAAANPELVALKAAVDKCKTADGAADATKLAEAGFTRFTPRTVGTETGYYTTYYYWNRHNDNNVADSMGEMEFAVVRNNVYKLAVTKISRLGHPYQPDPENPDPDPDPIDPTDPDESLEYYFEVSVKVLPWVVRINNIEF